MEINSQLQQNINTEIIPKQPKDLRETNNAPQNNNSKIAENIEQNVNMQISNNENNVLVQNENMTFQDHLTQLNNQNSIYDFSFDIDFGGIYSFNINETDKKDINFFLEILEKNKKEQIVQNIDLIPLSIKTPAITSSDETKNVQATEKIIQIVEMASKTEKPVRIDFDNQITVVLRVDKDGKISAQFYPGDKVAEEYLRNNIQNLRNTFDEKNILYSYLDYRQNKGNNGKERKEKQ